MRQIICRLSHEALNSFSNQNKTNYDCQKIFFTIVAEWIWISPLSVDNVTVLVYSFMINSFCSFDSVRTWIFVLQVLDTWAALRHNLYIIFACSKWMDANVWFYLVSVVSLLLFGFICYIPMPCVVRGQTGHTGMEQHFKLSQLSISPFHGCCVSALVSLNSVSGIQIPLRTLHRPSTCYQRLC